LSVEVKRCTHCKNEKPFSEFHKQPHGKFGLRGRCSVCATMFRKPIDPAKTKYYYEKNKEKIAARAKAKYWSDPKKHNLAVKQSRLKYYDKHLAYSRQYELEHKEERKLKDKVYAQNNPHKKAAIVLKRKVKQKQSIPKWSNIEMTKKIYKLRDRLNEHSGYIKYHVDHIIPISGKLVSGLHVIENLKIVLASYNLSKNNKYEVSL